MDDEDLRDLFAGLAMQGLIRHFDFDTYRQDPIRVARWSYDAADAMIKVKYEKDTAPQDDPEEGITAIKPKRKSK